MLHWWLKQQVKLLGNGKYPKPARKCALAARKNCLLAIITEQRGTAVLLGFGFGSFFLLCPLYCSKISGVRTTIPFTLKLPGF